MLSLPRLSLKALAAAGLIVLASCGGGDDDEAGAGELNATPSSFGYTASAASGCVMGTAGDTFYINGGAGPYTAQATSPGIVTLYTTDPTLRAQEVRNIPRGGAIRVYFEGGCTTETGVTILIKDALNKQTTVTVTNVTS